MQYTVLHLIPQNYSATMSVAKVLPSDQALGLFSPELIPSQENEKERLFY